VVAGVEQLVTSFWGRGCHYKPSSAACPPPKNTGLSPTGPGQALRLCHSPHTQHQLERATLCIAPVDATHVAAVPSTPAATSVNPPTAARPGSHTGVLPATGLRRRVRCTARLSLFLPR
jgi:hypothetical protein